MSEYRRDKRVFTLSYQIQRLGADLIILLRARRSQLMPCLRSAIARLPDEKAFKALVKAPSVSSPSGRGGGGCQTPEQLSRERHWVCQDHGTRNLISLITTDHCAQTAPTAGSPRGIPVVPLTHAS